MQIDTQGRIIGSFLIVTAYFIVLHVSATIGALMHLVANVISLPFFIRTKAHDVVIMLSFLMVISLTKLLWLRHYLFHLKHTLVTLIVILEQERMASKFVDLSVENGQQFITSVGML